MAAGQNAKNPPCDDAMRMQERERKKKKSKGSSKSNQRLLLTVCFAVSFNFPLLDCSFFQYLYEYNHLTFKMEGFLSVIYMIRAVRHVILEEGRSYH